ncbi:general stress protein CsbD [Bacteroidota bacterium]
MELILNQGNWDELKIKLKKKYPQLTEAELQHKEGMEQDMLRMVEYKLRKTKQEMREIIAGL